MKYIFTFLAIIFLITDFAHAQQAFDRYPGSKPEHKKYIRRPIQVSDFIMPLHGVVAEDKLKDIEATSLANEGTLPATTAAKIKTPGNNPSAGKRSIPPQAKAPNNFNIGGGGGGAKKKLGAKKPSQPELPQPTECQQINTGTNFCACSAGQNGEQCCPNDSPTQCFSAAGSSAACDYEGFITQKDPRYGSTEFAAFQRDYGYSQDYIVDYMMETGFFTPAEQAEIMGTDPTNTNDDAVKNPRSAFNQWKMLKEWLPENWLINESNYQQNSFLRAGGYEHLNSSGNMTKAFDFNKVKAGLTIAILDNCNYPMGQAAIVTMVDDLKQCVYLTSRNFLQDNCNQLSEKNCYQALRRYNPQDPMGTNITLGQIVPFGSSIPEVGMSGNYTPLKINNENYRLIPQTTDCISPENISFFITPKKDSGGTIQEVNVRTLNFNKDQKEFYKLQAQCDAKDDYVNMPIEEREKSCDRLCSASFESFCNRYRDQKNRLTPTPEWMSPSKQIVN